MIVTLASLTIGDVIRTLLPDGCNPYAQSAAEFEPRWDDVPRWAPDLFAVVATLAERSGFYAEPGIALSTDAKGRERKRKNAKRAEEIGGYWGGKSLGKPPAPVGELWRRLWDSETHHVCVGPGHGKLWKRAAMQLLAIADEACAGVGFPPQPRPLEGQPQQTAVFVWEEFRELGDLPEGSRILDQLPHSLAIAVPLDRACVLPKALTPEIGCTLRSTTHNLALLPGAGEVKPIWRLPYTPLLPVGAAAPSQHCNLLILPFPYVIADSTFRVGRKPEGMDADGYFELNMPWLPPGGPQEQAEQLTSFVLAAIAAAEQGSEAVDAIVMPETSLPMAVAERVAAAVAAQCQSLEMFICGVTAPPPVRPRGGDRPFPRNAAYVAQFRDGKQIDDFAQAKHHRWRLDPSQIKSYTLERTLAPAHNWWEMIDVADRQMVFSIDAREAVIATLICEDLARADPVLPVLSAIGPNLVIALLMDGPQLKFRWPARYASVLADDPGSAVLSVTSLGMVQRSQARPGDPKRDRCIALWTQRDGSREEIDLDPGAHGVLLTLQAHAHRQKTLDLRRQRDSGGLIQYQRIAHKSVMLANSDQFSWLEN